MGVWIEILCISHVHSLSPVAPLVGVWIEIFYVCIRPGPERVAPLVGVWIEIMSQYAVPEAASGRSPRGSVD